VAQKWHNQSVNFRPIQTSFAILTAKPFCANFLVVGAPKGKFMLRNVAANQELTQVPELQ
jgi:hypothetical protein